VSIDVLFFVWKSLKNHMSLIPRIDYLPFQIFLRFHIKPFPSILLSNSLIINIIHLNKNKSHTSTQEKLSYAAPQEAFASFYLLQARSQHAIQQKIRSEICNSLALYQQRTSNIQNKIRENRFQSCLSFYLVCTPQ